MGAFCAHFFIPKFMEVIIINNNQSFNQKQNKNQNEELVNENIRFKEMLVIGADGTKHGILQRRDAMKLAMESGLDLVVVSAEAKPPVAKLMDYKKFRFEQKKKTISLPAVKGKNLLRCKNLTPTPMPWVACKLLTTLANIGTSVPAIMKLPKMAQDGTLLTLKRTHRLLV